MSEGDARAAGALARAMVEACLAEAPMLDDPASLRRLLQRHGVTADDIAAIEAAPQRLQVHRALVRNGLSAPVARVLVETRERMNAECAGLFDRDFARFVAEVGPRTHHLRDVPAEFVLWATARWVASVPGYLVDLAQFELARAAIAQGGDQNGEQDEVAPDRRGGELAPDLHVAEVAPDRRIAFSGGLRVFRFDHPVHALERLESGAEAPNARSVHLVGYRDPDGGACFVEVSAPAAVVLERLRAGEVLEEALGAGRAVGTPVDLEELAALFAELAERGVLLGGVA